MPLRRYKQRIDFRRSAIHEIQRIFLSHGVNIRNVIVHRLSDKPILINLEFIFLRIEVGGNHIAMPFAHCSSCGGRIIGLEIPCSIRNIAGIVFASRASIDVIPCAAYSLAAPHSRFRSRIDKCSLTHSATGKETHGKCFSIISHNTLATRHQIKIKTHLAGTDCLPERHSQHTVCILFRHAQKSTILPAVSSILIRIKK